MALLEIIDVEPSLHGRRRPGKRLVKGLQNLVPYEFALCALVPYQARGVTDPYRIVNVSYPCFLARTPISRNTFDPDRSRCRRNIVYTSVFSTCQDSYEKAPRSQAVHSISAFLMTASRPGTPMA